MNKPDDRRITDPRSTSDLAKDRVISVKQNSTMGNHDDDYLHRVLDQIRAGRADDAALVQFDIVTKDGKVAALVAAGELVVRSAVVEKSAELRNELRQADFVRADVPDELAGHIERFVNKGMTGNELDQFSQGLRKQGFPVSVNHIAPMGYWMKSEDGPEHTTYHRDAPVLPESPGPVVAVIDTGIEQLGIRTDHWLDEIVRDTTNIDELDGPDPGTELDLGAGHGTFASGVVRQVSTHAEIRVVKALDASGLGTDVGVGAAMVRAVREGAEILNLSLGTRTLDDQPPPALDAALELIDAHVGPDGNGVDVLIIAAAGNFGDTRPCWPAAFPRVKSVAALTAAGAPSAWSTHGPWVTCSTVGEGISSPYVEGIESVIVDTTPDTFGPDDWAMWSGTSFAAPQIAGLAAQICADTGDAPLVAFTTILNSGSPVPGYGAKVMILPGT